VNERGEQLLADVYTELYAIARRYMRSEREGHTLQPTALLHEAYLRLFAHDAAVPAEMTKTHFVAMAARQMRRVLVDHARKLKSDKRNHGVKVVLDGVEVAQGENVDAETVDTLLRALEKLDARAAQIVELKFFGGLTDAEAAEALGVSTGTIRRDWEFARAWFSKQVTQ